MIETLSLATTLRSADDLAKAGLITFGAMDNAERVAKRYAIAVTPTIAALIDPADASDPIARQFIPDLRELDTLAIERADPIGDDAHSPVPGIVHRYPDRALVKMLHACPVYCRFCFRREMVGPGGKALVGAEFERAMAYLAASPGIWEVIITGGDPFMLSARRVEVLMEALAAISHIKVVRWHTRVPVVDPARVTPAFVRALKLGGKAVYVGIHANHPREFTLAARAAMTRLADAGIALVSQSVLLKGVNADVGTLTALMQAFVENRVLPYYLHHPDLAPGTAHFRLDLAEGQALMAELRGHLSGLAQPTYMLDIPDGHGKVPVGPGFASPDGKGGWQITDRAGVVHAYPPQPSPAETGTP
ncbi:MAG: lysine-2,3-aminomutase-like protein [Bosea sp. (in: a-proteobacteria)]